MTEVIARVVGRCWMGTVYWLQAGGCGGDTMSLLQAERPDVLELVAVLGLELLWHPSLSTGGARAHESLLAALTAGEQPLDVLCVEGAVLQGPGGTGRYDCLHGVPKKDIVAGLARQARYVVAVGTCAAFAGIPAEGPTEATGLQFRKGVRGGFLGASFVSRAGSPVINLPGCPVQPEPLKATLAALAVGGSVQLDALQAPDEWFGTLVHQGCTRNEYHEYRVEDADFGEPGCLFFHLGCLGPLTKASCNKHRWAGHSTGTRAGVPCVGCARPDFPRPHPFFHTRNIEGLPLDLPEGVDRAHFLASKTMAAAAAPARLRNRTSRI